MNLMAFLDGYVWGLAFVIFIGPVFFTLLQGALQYGFRSGFAVALGIFVSDIVAIAICYLGAGSAKAFFYQPTNQFYIALIGACILVGLGVKYLIKPSLDTSADIKMKTSDYLNFFIKGFLINFVNPFVFLVWISLIGFKSAKYGFGIELITFLTASLLGILTTDTLKAAFAHKIKDFLKPQYLLWTYRAIGVVLIGFGGRLLYLAFFGNFDVITSIISVH
ncbi:MAG: lysine transporter LysE [Bacteroidetes bacterium]|nr:MAG: lysine transporter LysE [Bacteroidota bacterium]